jgi:hypothetical protein
MKGPAQLLVIVFLVDEKQLRVDADAVRRLAAL